MVRQAKALQLKNKGSSRTENPGANAEDDCKLFVSKITPVEKGSETQIDGSQRLSIAQRISGLKTDPLNLLIYSLAPPENQIPPINAAARERAASLLDWCARESISPNEIENLLDKLAG